MDIRKLQRTIVDALEDVKAQDIQVFNTEALTSLFDRVIVASGTSNRQTRALAASVRDKVREAGGTVKNPEGAESGEWVLVDCGDAVVHIMQPTIRAYYKLEDIWGGKSVHLKARQDALAAERAAASGAKPAAKRPAAKSAGARSPAAKSAGAKRPAAKRPASRSPAAQSPAAKSPAAKSPAAKSPAAKSPASKSPASASKSASAKAPAAKRPAAGTAARKTTSAPRRTRTAG